MAHRAERTDCPAARLERAREHDAPSLGVVRRRPARDAARARGKVVFGRGSGAVAGVRGVAAVGVRVEGLPIGEGEGGDDDGDDEGTGRGVDGGLVLTGLPSQWSVRVGRKGLH
ncbi:hypothetical protein BJV78DRAFT_1154298 [Lactifluus subvellereus]|nr:hypothetical protein BJV78DRAFT_1154298 [Lactifluus subvellereus]